jgi:hypothetical protein
VPSTLVYPNILYSVNAFMIIFTGRVRKAFTFSGIPEKSHLVPNRFLVGEIFLMWLNDRLRIQNRKCRKQITSRTARKCRRFYFIVCWIFCFILFFKLNVATSQLISSYSCNRVGIEKPTQKNPPKKTQKNPPKKTH